MALHLIFPSCLSVKQTCGRHADHTALDAISRNLDFGHLAIPIIPFENCAAITRLDPTGQAVQHVSPAWR